MRAIPGRFPGAIGRKRCAIGRPGHPCSHLAHAPLAPFRSPRTHARRSAQFVPPTPHAARSALTRTRSPARTRTSVHGGGTLLRKSLSLDGAEQAQLHRPSYVSTASAHTSHLLFTTSSSALGTLPSLLPSTKWGDSYLTEKVSHSIVVHPSRIVNVHAGVCTSRSFHPVFMLVRAMCKLRGGGACERVAG